MTEEVLFTDEVLSTEDVRAALVTLAEQGREVDVWIDSGLIHMDGKTAAENIEVNERHSVRTITIKLNGVTMTMYACGFYFSCFDGKGFCCYYMYDEFNKNHNDYIEIFW